VGDGDSERGMGIVIGGKYKEGEGGRGRGGGDL
jgi:hypothetical protein